MRFVFLPVTMPSCSEFFPADNLFLLILKLTISRLQLNTIEPHVLHSGWILFRHKVRSSTPEWPPDA